MLRQVLKYLQMRGKLRLPVQNSWLNGSMRSAHTLIAAATTSSHRLQKIHATVPSEFMSRANLRSWPRSIGVHVPLESTRTACCGAIVPWATDKYYFTTGKTGSAYTQIPCRDTSVHVPKRPSIHNCTYLLIRLSVSGNRPRCCQNCFRVVRVVPASFDAVRNAEHLVGKHRANLAHSIVVRQNVRRLHPHIRLSQRCVLERIHCPYQLVQSGSRQLESSRQWAPCFLGQQQPTCRASKASAMLRITFKVPSGPHACSTRALHESKKLLCTPGGKTTVVVLLPAMRTALHSTSLLEINSWGRYSSKVTEQSSVRVPGATHTRR